jgi:hypothetical protein
MTCPARFDSTNCCPTTPLKMDRHVPSCLVFLPEDTSFRNNKPQASLRTRYLLILIRLAAQRGQTTRPTKNNLGSEAAFQGDLDDTCALPFDYWMSFCGDKSA